MVNEPSKWDEATYGPMSLESIRRLFQPESRYRVSWKKYPAGDAFKEWSAAGRRYIISGSCMIRGAGSVGLYPRASFSACLRRLLVLVPGEAPVELAPSELPESFWRTSRCRRRFSNKLHLENTVTKRQRRRTRWTAAERVKKLL